MELLCASKLRTFKEGFKMNSTTVARQSRSECYAPVILTQNVIHPDNA